MAINLLIPLILLPIVAAFLAALSPARLAGWFAAGSALLTLALSLGVASQASGMDIGHLTQEVNYTWLPVLKVNFHLGVDGPSALLVVLTTFLTLFAVIYSAHFVKEKTSLFLALLLLVEAFTIGAFVSLDLILFYLFFELCLIPMYFLIGIWGGPKRIAAATKFFVYTVVGSLLMLAAIIALYLSTTRDPRGPSFDYMVVRDIVTTPGALPVGVAVAIFAGFAIAFAVKTGVFPFHTWLPDAYGEAPTGAVVLLSGAMAKLGTYGFYRFCLGLFPEAAKVCGPYLVILGVISILYGALVASVQRDAKRVIAYSSVSHLGFVTLGLFAFTPQALSGALLQQLNHGITAGMLFLILGMIEERRGTTVIRQLGGLWEQMPVFGRLFLIATLSSVALPLTNGFVGEFLILLGAFGSHPIATAFAATGVIWSAVYMLWMFQRVMYGPVANPRNRRLSDITGFETAILVCFAIPIFLLGLYPALLTRPMDLAMTATIGAIQAAPEPPDSTATVMAR